MSSSEHDSPSDRDQPEAAPPATLAPFKPQPRQRIEYLTAFRYVFTHPEWMKNLLLFAVFTLIPVLNTVLVYGYLYETTEHLLRRMPGPYPMFEVRRFAHYMTRGIWCYFIVQILGVIIAPFIVISFDGTMFGTLAVSRANQAAAAVVLAVVAPLVVTFLFVFLLSLSIVVTPFLLRAGLSQDFGLTFNFRWIADFLRKMWLDVLFVNVFAWLSGIVLTALGCALFCYGALVAGALITLASAHLNWQLYELYLSRGGEPIPLKTPLAESPKH
jgi:Protein of unknown function (DUF4013)